MLLKCSSLIFAGMLQQPQINISILLAENIRSFMYKYNILFGDWQSPLSYLVRKVYKYDDHFVNIDIMSV